jgi:SnoaL-like domain
MARIDDIEEIRQLSYKYFWGWDADEVEVMINVFTEDGVNDQTRNGSFIVKGHDELRKHFNEWRPAMAHVFHMVGNHIIEFDDDDHAHGTNCQDGIAVMKDGSRLSGKHYFSDEYVRTPKGWRISKRVALELLPE